MARGENSASDLHRSVHAAIEEGDALIAELSDGNDAHALRRAVTVAMLVYHLRALMTAEARARRGEP